MADRGRELGLKHLRAGIVGLGWIGLTKHLPVFKRESRLKVVAVASRRLDHTRKIANMYHIPGYYSNISEMLEKEDLDVVSICTPPQTHSTLAVEALERGCHVLVEKPMAVTANEAQRMINASKRNQVKLCVVHNCLFDRSVQRALADLRKGLLGDLVYTVVDHKTILRTDLPTWIFDLPGQLIYDEAVHMAYLVLAFMKDATVSRVAFRKCCRRSPVDIDYFEASMTDHQTTALMSAFFSSPRTEWTTTVVGTKEILVIDNQRDIYVRMGPRSSKPIAFAISGVHSLLQQAAGLAVKAVRYLSNQNAHRTITSMFIDSIINDKDPPTTGEEGKRAVEIMDQIVRGLRQT